MSDTNHQIHLALRTAAGHARAAQEVESRAEEQYVMKMKSAGAALWEAWGLAVRALPENRDRKIDDKALLRIYTGTKPRPWWDQHLSAVKVDGKPATRDWAKRTVQWHTDLDGAKARRAQRAVESQAYYRKVKQAATAAVRKHNSGASRPPSAQELKQFAAAHTHPAHQPRTGRELANEIKRLLAQVAVAAGRADPEMAVSILTDTVEQLERNEA